MSASREKKKRLDQVEGETSTVEQGKKGLGKTGKTVIGIVVAIALIAVIVFFAMINVGFFEKHTTAAEVNGHKLTPAMVNYYYANVLQNQNTQQMLAYLTDPEVPLSEQAYMTDEYANWSDYLMDMALSSAQETYSIYDEALANGFVLSEDGKAAIQQEIETTNMMAPMYGAVNGDALMASTYGKGCNLKSYEEFLTVGFTTQEYVNSIVEKLEYTQEEMDAFYAENPLEIDGYNYRSYAVLAEKDEEGNASEEAVKAAEENAKKIAEAGKSDEQAYLDTVAEVAAQDEFDADAATLCKDYNASVMVESTRDWLVDAARQEGDTTYIANDAGNGFFVLYYLGKADHSYQLPTVRHALFGFDNAAEDQEAAKAEAKANAQAALDEFLAGDTTEDAFAEMAKAKSSDQGSAANGGLYENITKGQMVAPFEDWCFDAARKPGDTGIVETEYGYHVMYFVENGATMHDFLVENTMRSNDYNEWMTAATEGGSHELISDRYVATR